MSLSITRFDSYMLTFDAQQLRVRWSRPHASAAIIIGCLFMALGIGMSHMMLTTRTTDGLLVWHPPGGASSLDQYRLGERIAVGISIVLFWGIFVFSGGFLAVIALREICLEWRFDKSAGTLWRGKRCWQLSEFRAVRLESDVLMKTTIGLSVFLEPVDGRKLRVIRGLIGKWATADSVHRRLHPIATEMAGWLALPLNIG